MADMISIFLISSKNTYQTRGHALKNYSRTDFHNNFFTRRAINPWNNLPKEVISATTTEYLKDGYLPKKFRILMYFY